MANPSDPGFRMTTHSPEELERFAALFIPTWELPADVATGPDPGFKAAAMDVATVAALSAPKPSPIKSTMMGIMMPAAPAPAPVEPAPVVVAAPPAPMPVAAPPMVAPAAPLAPPPAFRAQPVTSIDDDFEPAPKKKSGMIFAVIGGLAVVGAIGAFIATRGGDEAKTKSDTPTEKTTEKKTMELPEPTVAPAEAKTAEPPAKTAEPTPPPKETATAKAPEPPPPPPPKATAAPPPPPKAAVAPAPKATTAPAPKATAPAAPPPKKTQKIKDEF